MTITTILNTLIVIAKTLNSKNHKAIKTRRVRTTTTIIEESPKTKTIIIIMRIIQMINRFILMKMTILIWIKGGEGRRGLKTKKLSLRKLLKVIK